MQGRGTIYLKHFSLESCWLLALDSCNILLNRNFAAEIVGRMQERQLFLSSIAFRNASDDIQVFNEMFVSCNVRSCVTTEISGPGVCNFKFQCIYTLCNHQISSTKDTMAEWERSTVVTARFRVRIQVGSLIGYGILLFLVVWASVLFASSEGYMCDWHGPAKSPMSASLSLLCLRLIWNILTSSHHLVPRGWLANRRQQA